MIYEQVLVVGDVGGQYNALIRLVDKHGKGRKVISLGDLNDRGPKSKECIEWAIQGEKDGSVITLQSNHGHMFYSLLTGESTLFYYLKDFFVNGGFATLKSYGGGDQEVGLYYQDYLKRLKEVVPQSHIDFLKSCRQAIYLEGDTRDTSYLLSHAPLPSNLLKDYVDWYDYGKLPQEENMHYMVDWFWNRCQPVKLPYWQVFGHNSYWRSFIKEEDKTICLDDTTFGKCVTGLLLPERVLVKENFIKD